MFGPGVYVPDPTEGIVAVKDLPAPQCVPYSRNQRYTPCPRCDQRAARHTAGQRTLHDLGDLNLDPVTAGFDVVISGHSHRPRVETIDGVLFINPGSAGPRRFRLPITLATLDMSDDAIRPEIHQLS